MAEYKVNIRYIWTTHYDNPDWWNTAIMSRLHSNCCSVGDIEQRYQITIVGFERRDVTLIFESEEHFCEFLLKYC